MSTDTKVTVTGWVGTQPKHFVPESGTDFTSFRLASTKRFYNRAEDCWVDGLTTWFTVKAWRSMAINIAESLRKSDPVVVHGTLTSETWDSPDGPRTTLVIEADAAGPDLARGQATFRHTVHTKAPDAQATESTVSAPPASAPDAPADPWAVDAAAEGGRAPDAQAGDPDAQAPQDDAERSPGDAGELADDDRVVA